MFYLPVVLLRMARVVNRRNCVHTPFFRSSWGSRASFICSYLPRAIRAISTPFRFKFRSSQIVGFMIHLIMDLLRTSRSIRSIIHRFLMFFYFGERCFGLRITRMELYRVRYANGMESAYDYEVFAHGGRGVLRKYRSFSDFMFISSFFLHRCNPFRQVASVRATMRAEVNA